MSVTIKDESSDEDMGGDLVADLLGARPPVMPPVPAAPVDAAPKRTAPPPAVEIVGNVSTSDVEMWRQKYGNALVAVRDVESVPELKERHGKQDTFTYIMSGLRDGLMKPDMAVEETPSLIGIYHQEANGAPKLEYKPDSAFIHIPVGAFVTDEMERHMRSAFNMGTKEINELRTTVNKMRSDRSREDSQIAINIFKPVKKDPATVHKIRDMPSGMTIYALGMLMIPTMPEAQIGTIVQMVGTVIGERMRLDMPVRTSKQEFVRCAWLNTMRGEFIFYASFDTEKGTDDSKEKTERALANELARMQATDQTKANHAPALAAFERARAADIVTPVVPPKDLS